MSTGGVDPGGPEPEPEVVLDCRGLPCPRPIVELARHLGDVAVGGLLAVDADDVAARFDVPAWCRMKGQTYVGEQAAPDGTPRFVVRRVS